MNKKSGKGKSWRNPSFVENTGAEKISQSLLQGDVLRKKAAAGWALGTFLIELPCTETLSAIALAGFDFVVLDMEHSSIDFSRLENLIYAGQASGLALLVRTWGKDIGLIGKVLDMGAHGIMAPHVGTPERAREIVEQSRFTPYGSRGFSPLTKYDALQEPLESLSHSAYVVVQIEGSDAIDRVSEIAAVPGIDTVFVGPYDLALSLGVPPGSEAVYIAAERIAEAVPEDTGLGIYIDDPALCSDWAARGFALQCVSFDGRMLSSGARLIATQARSGMDNKKKQKGKPQ